MTRARRQKRRPAAAAAQRTLDAEQRVRKALRELDREGATISFVSVAQRARVSRAFLYANADFRGEIEALRQPGWLPDAAPSSRARQ